MTTGWRCAALNPVKVRAVFLHPFRHFRPLLRELEQPILLSGILRKCRLVAACLLSCLINCQSWSHDAVLHAPVPIVNSKSERTDGGDRLRSAPKARGQPSWVFGRDGGRQQRAEATVAPAGRAIRSCRDDRDYRCRPSWRSREALAGFTLGLTVRCWSTYGGGSSSSGTRDGAACSSCMAAAIDTLAISISFSRSSAFCAKPASRMQSRAKSAHSWNLATTRISRRKGAVPVGNLRSNIPVVKPAQDRYGQCLTDGLDGARNRCVLLQW